MSVSKADLEIRFSGNIADAVAGIDRLGEKVKGLSLTIAELCCYAIDFENQQRNVLSITDLTDDQIADLSRQVDALAKAVEQDPQVLAEGLFDIYEDEEGQG